MNRRLSEKCVGLVLHFVHVLNLFLDFIFDFCVPILYFVHVLNLFLDLTSIFWCFPEAHFRYTTITRSAAVRA